MKRVAITAFVLYLIGFVVSILVAFANTSNPPEPLEGTEPIFYVFLVTPLLLLVETPLLIAMLIRRHRRNRASSNQATANTEVQ